jgi:1,4-dihydroxy-2-naphthoate octaprenyltransferase
MLKSLAAFVRLSRPHFLLGGLLLYGLGALIARYQGYRIDWGAYLVGQLFVTSLQLMTQYLNEYWDVEVDRHNQSRTPFSGGSGVLSSGGLSRETAFTAAIACLAVGTGAAIWLIFEFDAGPAIWAVLALIFLGAYFYSSPPLSLAGSGFGELTASIVVAGLVPALAHLLQTGLPSPLVVLATAPLVVLHFAMLLAFEIPDFLSDEAAGKRTLLVRLGRRLGMRVHNAALLLAVTLAVLATFAGLPARVALAVVIASPLLLLQLVNMRRLQRGEPLPFSWLTFLAIAIFSVTAYLTAMGFWVLAYGAV